eukprot:TRINITY_DN23348_c0_g1_i1.p1 TRINITY_DN23348_c0_g1~~TRINITY_DN23348_c0_g1_i1.p1  ORF type:complete len:242 (+),score=37.44 TRINITY_DN23348_c0_g1_i1:81-728(+)
MSRVSDRYIRELASMKEAFGVVEETSTHTGDSDEVKQLVSELHDLEVKRTWVQESIEGLKKGAAVLDVRDFKSKILLAAPIDPAPSPEKRIPVKKKPKKKPQSAANPNLKTAADEVETLIEKLLMSRDGFQKQTANLARADSCLKGAAPLLSSSSLSSTRHTRISSGNVSIASSKHTRNLLSSGSLASFVTTATTATTTTTTSSSSSSGSESESS